MAKYKDTVSEATEELSVSVREANQAITDSAVAAQERNWKYVQSTFENEVELFKSHAESTRALMEKFIGESEKGQPLFQWVAESMVAAQERNVQVVQSFLENGTELVRSHAESTRVLTQTLTEEAQKQREAFGELARGTWDVYRGFLSSPFSFYKKAMESAESIAMHGMGAAEKAPHHEKQAVRSATK